MQGGDSPVFSGGDLPTAGVVQALPFFTIRWSCAKWDNSGRDRLCLLWYLFGSGHQTFIDLVGFAAKKAPGPVRAGWNMNGSACLIRSGFEFPYDICNAICPVNDGCRDSVDLDSAFGATAGGLGDSADIL